MSRTEDYLDSLLNNVSPEQRVKAEERELESGADYIEDFEKDLNDPEMEDFIRDFEMEIDESEENPMENEQEDGFFDNLENIVKNARNKMERKRSSGKEAEQAEEEQQSEADGDEDDYEVNTLGEDFPENGEKAAADFTEKSDEEKDVMELLEEVTQDDEISNLGQLLKADEQENEASEEAAGAEKTDMASNSKGKGSKKEKKSRKKKKGEGNFLQKMSNILFGVSEEDELDNKEAQAEDQKPDIAMSEEELENLSEEERQILQELSAAEAAGKDSAGEKKKEKKEKKKSKKEKKPKKKKEKKVKEKKVKEKKPKKPKEVDLSPPLPKGPVILIFVMGISIILLVMLFSNLVGYSLNIANAKEGYKNRNYVEAYHRMDGLNIKENDMEFYEKVLLLAAVQEQYEDGNALYEAKQYKMSLDSYVSALGRYDANYQDAVNYDIQSEYDALAEKITEQLKTLYGVDADTAREIYGLRNRTEYTRRIYDIIEALGLE